MSTISASTTSTTALVYTADTTGTLALQTGASPTTAVYLDSSQNVGIGTSSPNYKLDITGQGRATTGFAVSADGSTFTPSGLNAIPNYGTGYITSTSQVATSGFGGLIFYTNQAERARIDSSGNLLVGATTQTAGFTSSIVVGGKASPIIKWQSTTGPHAWDLYSNGGANFYFAYDSTDKANINSSTGVYTALSDVNKKKDFEPSNVGLAEVLQLQPKLFRMLDDADDAQKSLGFIAQEVQPLIPQAYVAQEGASGTFIGLQDRPIIAALTKAIQEQQAIIQAQAADIAALKEKVGI
jgi:Chaperone of endosialidase